MNISQVVVAEIAEIEKVIFDGKERDVVCFR